MSIVRWGTEGSDVYIYGDPSGWCCANCALPDNHVLYGRGVEPMLAHVKAHRDRGHTVPAWVEEHLQKEHEEV